MTTGLYPQELIISFSNLTSLSAVATKTANGKQPLNCHQFCRAWGCDGDNAPCLVRRMVIKSSNQAEGSEFDTIIEKGEL